MPTESRDVLLAKINDIDAQISKAMLLLINPAHEPDRDRLKELIAFLRHQTGELRDKLPPIGSGAVLQGFGSLRT